MGGLGNRAGSGEIFLSLALLNIVEDKLMKCGSVW